MSFLDPQNPGIGGFDELTEAEEVFLTTFAGLSFANGDILYYDNGQLKRLPKGSNGQFLSLATGLPIWVDSPRVVSATSYTTDTGTSLDISTCDLFIITAQAGALKFNNPSGTPVQGKKLMIRIKDDGTARALTYDTQFRASSDLALPTTTVLSKTLYMGFIYNSTDTKWDLIAVLNNFT